MANKLMRHLPLFGFIGEEKSADTTTKSPIDWLVNTDSLSYF